MTSKGPCFLSLLAFLRNVWGGVLGILIISLYLIFFLGEGRQGEHGFPSDLAGGIFILIPS